MKQCPTCEQTLPISEFFKNISKRDGLDYACKACKKKKHNKICEKRREVRRRQKDADKIAARAKAWNRYKNKNLKCAVMGCETKMETLHHMDYSKPLEVIALCNKHHALEHHTHCEFYELQRLLRNP